eukprot:172214-Chlamydomonas_euryale.AAC.3
MHAAVGLAWKRATSRTKFTSDGKAASIQHIKQRKDLPYMCLMPMHKTACDAEPIINEEHKACISAAVCCASTCSFFNAVGEVDGKSSSWEALGGQWTVDGALKQLVCCVWAPMPCHHIRFPA